MPEGSGYPRDSPIQIWPKGLLGLLELKNGGQYPQRLLTDLQPTIELLKWFGSANAETIAVNNVGITTQTVSPAGAVPANEAWYIRECSARASNLAASGATICCGKLTPTLIGVGSIPIAKPDRFLQVTGLAALRPEELFSSYRDVILMPGESPSCRVVSLGAVDVLTVVQWVRMPL